MKKFNYLILFCLIICGLIFNLYKLDFQGYLTTGDHGQDLYASFATSLGDLPYRDYWREYGPLMPFYYAKLFTTFDVSLQTVLVGKQTLIFISGILTYLILYPFIGIPFAVSAALWFWAFYPDFFYTYNHTGGTFFTLLFCFCFSQFIINRKKYELMFAALASLLLCLVKPNFGTVSFLTLLAVLYIDQKLLKNPPSKLSKRLVITICLLWSGLAFGCYLYLIYPLPKYAILQCFPYWGKYENFSASVLYTIPLWLKTSFSMAFKTWLNTIHSLVFYICLFFTIKSFIKNKSHDPLVRNQMLLSFTLGILILGFFHEFLLSGIVHRVHWLKPLTTLLIFLVFAIAFRKTPLWVQISWITFLLVITALKHNHEFQRIQNTKTPDQYLYLPKANVCVNNSPQWIATITQTTDFLASRLKEGELFLALPNDSLFYFLLERKSPVWPLSFYHYRYITPTQEQQVIDACEKKRINYILISNKIYQMREKHGLFGISHCRLLKEYILDNYEVVATFGSWKDWPSYSGRYGTRILKRKSN